MQNYLGCRESYSWEHYERLRKFEYARPFDTREKVRCVEVHPRSVPKCARCTTCHFCRWVCIALHPVLAM